MKQVIEMQQFKETKGTVVYTAVPNAGKEVAPLVRSLYLTKGVLPKPYPDNITVTVEASDD